MNATPDHKEATGPSDGVTSPAAEATPAADAAAAVREQLLRLQADFENYRKRVKRDQADQQHKTLHRYFLDLLPVLDHFELGMNVARNQNIPAPVLAGFDLVYQQFLQVLRKAGVTPVETAGAEFNPHQHECVAHVPSEEHPENRIISETRRGYLLGAHLLRAAQVIVSSGPAAPERAPAPEGDPQHGA